MSTHRKPIFLAACALLGGATPAVLAAERDADSRPRGHDGERVALLERPGDRFAQSVDVHEARREYADALDSARDADVEPKRNLIAGSSVAPSRLERAARQLRERADEARQEEAASPESYGVSQATLESIAACESGGDPAAVSSDGTYRGKYQFDTGTWASVGGQGDPAAAPEAEQDMRAAMLYSRAGSSPWPICGS